MKKPDQQYQNPPSSSLPSNELVSPTPSVPKLDISKYQPYIDDFDLTKEQQQELLETLWSIMSAFVDIGFGVDVVQMLFNDQSSVSSNSKENDLKILNQKEEFNLISMDVQRKENSL